MRITGKYQKIGEIEYFSPFDLPPKNPSFVLDEEIVSLSDKANFSLGRLNETTLGLPNITHFIKSLLIKEATLSSSIEGIETTLLNIYTDDCNSVKTNVSDKLVINYTRALRGALDILQNDKMPLFSNIILKAHLILMDKEGSAGEYRKQSITNNSITAPAAEDIMKLMTNLEQYLKQQDNLPILIKSGLIHLQFVTISPFLKGNGHIGRILIILMLIKYGLLNQPILPVSYYLKKHSSDYHQKLNNVRLKGDFENWIKFYLKAIEASSNLAYDTVKSIEKLEIKLQQFIKAHDKFAKMRETALSIANILFEYPVIGIVELSKKSNRTYNAVHNIVNIFVELGVLQKDEEKKRNKLYYFKPYIDLLNTD